MANTQSSSKMSARLQYMVRLAILTAILLILNYTPLGFLRIGVIEMTLLQVPVIIGAIVLGPAAGTILGTVFGILSLSQAPVSPIFAPVLTSVGRWLLIACVCIIPRALTGFLSGIVYKTFRSFDRTNGIISYSASGIIGSLFNTVFFISGVILLLSDYIRDVMYGLGLLAEKSVAMFFITAGVTNGIPEAIVSGILVTAVCKALMTMYNRNTKTA